MSAKIFVWGGFVLSVVTAIILIISIYLLDTLIKKYVSENFMAKESLMKIHTILFVCNIVSGTAFILAQQLEW